MESLGVIKEKQDGYTPREWYRDDIETLAEFVQIEENGEWRNINLNQEEKDKLAEDGAEIVYWLS